jgi:hypothetical protein
MSLEQSKVQSLGDIISPIDSGIMTPINGLDKFDVYICKAKIDNQFQKRSSVLENRSSVLENLTFPDMQCIPEESSTRVHNEDSNSLSKH